MNESCDFIKRLDKIAYNVEDNKERFLYTYSRKIVDEEIALHEYLDSKSMRLTSLLSLLITVAIAFLNWLVQEQDQNLPMCFYAFYVATAVFLILAWWHFFNALKMVTSKRLPLDQSTMKMFKDKSISDVYISISKACIHVVESLSDINYRKSTALESGYNMIFISAITFLISVVLFFGSYIDDSFKGKIIMNQTNSHSEKKMDKPEPDYDAPPLHTRNVKTEVEKVPTSNESHSSSDFD
ncbi:hypothetical protein L0990_12580 [Vibrio kanaloae]|nr:hypothetical protein BCU75_14250 [Vibrio splendidus]